MILNFGYRCREMVVCSTAGIVEETQVRSS
jgi:hypothetical protein